MSPVAFRVLALLYGTHPTEQTPLAVRLLASLQMDEAQAALRELYGLGLVERCWKFKSRYRLTPEGIAKCEGKS